MGHIYFGRNTNWMCPFCLTENHILLNTCKAKQISENKEEVMKKQKVPDLEKYIEGKGRRFVSYAQGAKCCKSGKGQASLLLSWIFGSKN